jgi:hypothetical protein
MPKKLGATYMSDLVINSMNPCQFKFKALLLIPKIYVSFNNSLTQTTSKQ